MTKITAAALLLSLNVVAWAGESPYLDNPRVFSCSPSSVSTGDVITIVKSDPRLKELSVVRPGEITGHFLVVGLPPPEMDPLMSPDELASAKKLVISVDGLTGLEWRMGSTQERVFTVPGVYEFILSPNLESDDYAYVCRVRFQPSGKRANNSFKPNPHQGGA